MSDKKLWVILVLLLLLQNAYPIYQFSTGDGYLFYTNAFDEETWLQYDFSRASQSPTRVAQYVVTLLHEIGFSGGWINLIFDVLSVSAFLLFSSRSFELAGFDRKTANQHAFLLTFLPLLFGGLNPFVRQIFDWNLSYGTIYWFTVPEASFLPLVRSPEPQFSLMLLSLFTYLSLKKKTFFLMYCCLPFLYPFVAVPAAFVVISLHLKHAHSWTGRSVLLPPILACGLVGFGLLAFFKLLVSERTRESLTSTHEPLISFSALVALAIYFAGYKQCESRFRFLLWMIGLAPMVAANQQVITGWLAQPNNFEQNFGIVCVALAVTLTVHRRAIRQALVVGALALVMLSSFVSFQANDAGNRKIALNAELREKLQTDSRHVAINDSKVASVVSLMYSKQPMTAFGYQRTFSVVCDDEAVREYLCAKRTTLANAEVADDFRKMFRSLDEGYVYSWSDFILLHVGRKKNLHARHELCSPHENSRSCPLYYVVLEK